MLIARHHRPFAAVVGGVMLAAALASVIGLTLPERDTPNVSAGPSPLLNFAVLGRGANLADLERGRVYYAQLCMPCHGIRGDGQGEWAYRVTPRPSDLTGAQVRQRSDDYLFNAVSNGLAGTAMVGWKDRLSETQRWQVVLYLRHLGGGNATAMPAPGPIDV